jgi:hypothetical protein
MGMKSTMTIPKSVLLLAALSAALSGAVLAEDTCQLPEIDSFLEHCPTNDPAVGQILTDFTITKNGAPVTFGSGSCVEPMSTLPAAQLTDELTLLQALRTMYYLDRDRCGHLPWTALSLYDWVHSKVGGFNIDTAMSSGANCCGMWPDGRFYINVGGSTAFSLDNRRRWEGIFQLISVLMHETRHRDGFPHVNCCPAGSNCDQTYDETNLSPHGIQYWLDRSWLNGSIHTGYTCLDPTRIQSIKNILWSEANGKTNQFCSNNPPALTDANNPPPACDQRCATSVTCVAPAFGIPPTGGPPKWWSTSPPEPVYHNQLDDPRWSGASKITYGDGTGEKVEFRALHDASYFYLSWRAFVAPASTPDQNTLYFGYRSGGGGDVIVSVSLSSLAAATASASQLTLTAFLRNPDGTQGSAVTLPPEIPATARVWVDPAAPGSWAVQVQLPISALQVTCGRAQIWYDLLTGTPTNPVASFTWPRSGADVDGGTVASPHPPIYPDPAIWNWLRPSTGPGDPRCASEGVSLDYSNIGTTNTPASEIRFSAAAPHPNNTFFARPTNHSGAAIAAGAITATFRLANWGSVPGDWEQGVPSNQLWAAIPGGTDVPTSGLIANGATADATNQSHFDWTVTGSDLAQFTSGARRPHQCMLVELKSSAPGLTFTNASVYRNMDLVSASKFKRDALLSVKGLTATPGGARDLYLYVETQDMPERASPTPPPERTAVPTKAHDQTEGRNNLEAGRPVPSEGQGSDHPLPTYRVHVYYDTSKVVSLGGTTRPVLHHQTSFGYQVTHQGDLQGWRNELEGIGLVKLAPNWFRIPVADGGQVSVTTTIEAVEREARPLWLLLLILLILAAIFALWYFAKNPF